MKVINCKMLLINRLVINLWINRLWCLAHGSWPFPGHGQWAGSNTLGPSDPKVGYIRPAVGCSRSQPHPSQHLPPIVRKDCIDPCLDQLGQSFKKFFPGSVFPKSGLVAFLCALACATLHSSLRNLTELLDDDPVISAVGTSVLAGFTSILGFLIVFRSQQAYARWWEGATLLQQIRGEWFNAYSSLLAFTNEAPAKDRDVFVFEHRLVRLFSLLYATALEQVSTSDDKQFEIIKLDGLLHCRLWGWFKQLFLIIAHFLHSPRTDVKIELCRGVARKLLLEERFFN